MATKTVNNAKICQVSNTKSGFGNSVLVRGQLAYETDTNRMKIGIGEQSYTGLNYIDMDLPTGSSVEMAASKAPPGYLLQNGAAVSRTTYAELFSVIGTRYGAGNGSTTFNLPNSTEKNCTGTNTDSQVGTSGGTWGHYHSTSSYNSAIGAVNNDTATFGYYAIGRDNTYGFTQGIYTYWNPGDEGTVGVSWTNHGTICEDTNSSISNMVPALLHVYKLIKY